MATTALISLAEYMRTSYRPDREYIDGEVRERDVGTWEHARMMALLAGWFGSYETDWDVISALSWRTKVSANRVRVPDVVLVTAGKQPEVLTAPAVLIVEILSPDDTYADTQDRASDYRRMGVQTIWIIDPKTRTGRYCVDGAWTAATSLIVPGTQIFVDLDMLFARLDRNSA